MRIALVCLALLLSACQHHAATHSATHHAAATNHPAKHAVPIEQLEPDFLFIAAQTAIDNGHLATAAAYLKVVVSKDPYATLPRAQLAEALLKSGQATASLPHFAYLLDGKARKQLDANEQLRLRMLQAAAQLASNHIDDAIATLRRVVHRHPDHLPARLQLAKLYLTQRDAEQALAVIAEGIAHHDAPRLRQMEAQILLKQGKPKAALKSLEKMQQLAPDNPVIAILFSQFALQMGNTDLAEQRLRQFLRRHPDNLNVTRELGSLLVQHGRSGEAELLYQQLLKRNPAMHEARTTLGLLYIQTGQYDKAEKLFAGQKGDSDRFYYAASIEAQKRDKEALALYRAFPPSSPMRAQAQLRIAAIDVRAGRDKQALTIVRHLLAGKALPHPQRSEAWALLSAILLYQERYQQVIDETAPALDQPQVAPRLLFNRAVAFEHFHRYDEAETMLRAQLKQQPNNSEALNFFGYMLAEQGVRLDEAEQLIRRALNGKPDDGYYLDSLAWVYYQRGDFKQAIRIQKQALKQVSDDAVMAEHMGDMLWKNGDPDGARRQWRRALALKHPHPEAVKRKIKQGVP